MPIDERYRQQLDLLVRTLPSLAAKPVFALKGGTAINLFIRNLPRLSVEIDLTYLPLKSPDEALTDIEDALTRIGSSISQSMPDSHRFVQHIQSAVCSACATNGSNKPKPTDSAFSTNDCLQAGSDRLE